MSEQLKTPWTDTVGDKPWQEYPRPQFVRDSYVNLNGWWDYAITNTDEFPTQYDGKILVPFSPESALSGVGKVLQNNQYLYYYRTFSVTKSFNKGIVLLHFGAVDYCCNVFVNGTLVCHHEGGYNAFTVDITQAITVGENVLQLQVQDDTDRSYHCRGKQSSNPTEIWYTPQSGIWQTVWLESVPSQYIADIRITPDYDNAQVVIDLDCNFDERVTVTVFDNQTQVAQADGKGQIIVKFANGFTPWTPENPHLYNITVISRRDMVRSYFAMRKFGVEKVGKYNRFMLNNQPYFCNGLLDQGYWCDGLYTAPCDEALVWDISTAKQLGFNTLRKHIKVEPMRWYYHCDRLGVIVWQDMPNGGRKDIDWKDRNHKDNNYRKFGRLDEQGRDEFVAQYLEMLDQLYNCPCIAVWTPFNEGWGQFNANQIAQLTKEQDATRLVDHASGGFDQGGGDLNSFHVYRKKVKLPRDKKRIVALTEFGGYNSTVQDHSWSTSDEFGYKKSTAGTLSNDLVVLYNRDVIEQIPRGLSACIYTQLTDVESETNGLITYDRQVVKVDAELIKRINDKVEL